MLNSKPVYVDRKSSTQSSSMRFISDFVRRIRADQVLSCENEDRECLDSHALDNQAAALKARWHSKCNDYISLKFNVTTPRLSRLSTTTGIINNPDYCSYALSMCAVATASVNSCASEYPTAKPFEKFSRCICNDEILSANSVCEYDFSKSFV